MPNNYNHEGYDQVTPPGGPRWLFVRRWVQGLVEAWWLAPGGSSISVLLPEAIFPEDQYNRLRNTAFQEMADMMMEFSRIVLFCARLLLARDQEIGQRGKSAVKQVLRALQSLRRQLERQYSEELTTLPQIEPPPAPAECPICSKEH